MDEGEDEGEGEGDRGRTVKRDQNKSVEKAEGEVEGEAEGTKPGTTIVVQEKRGYEAKEKGKRTKDGSNEVLLDKNVDDAAGNKDGVVEVGQKRTAGDIPEEDKGDDVICQADVIEPQRGGAEAEAPRNKDVKDGKDRKHGKIIAEEGCVMEHNLRKRKKQQ